MTSRSARFLPSQRKIAASMLFKRASTMSTVIYQHRRSPFLLRITAVLVAEIYAIVVIAENTKVSGRQGDYSVISRN